MKTMKTKYSDVNSFEKAELELLREALKRSYKERFLMATKLYKIQKTMQRAIITHKPAQ